ncbi:MAG: hypothetical protein Q9172_007604 [Xanthocarpia lactea]
MHGQKHRQDLHTRRREVVHGLLTTFCYFSILSSLLPSNQLLHCVFQIALFPRPKTLSKPFVAFNRYHLIQFRLTDFEMANNTVWQVSHYLVIVVHLIMFIAGIATFVNNGQDLSAKNVDNVKNINVKGVNEDANTKSVPWAVGGVVSSLPPPPSRHSQKVPILMNSFIQGIAGLICTALVFWRLLYLQHASPAGITQEAYYVKRKIAYISSIALQGCLVIADIASGAAVAGKVSVYGNLAAPVAFAFIAA